MKKSVTMLLSISLILLSLCAFSAEETGRIVKNWNMEPNGGIVANLELCSSSLNLSGSPVQNGYSSNKIILDKCANNFLGVDGSSAYSARMISYQDKGYAALIDGYNASSNPVKEGFTYFKSCMMKLNPEHTDAPIQAGKEIYSFTDVGGGAGFTSDAKSFKTKLSSFKGGETIPGYDWAGTSVGTVKNKLTTDWQRVTVCTYRASGDSKNTATRERAGWVVWGKDWGTNYWTGNWEILVDDYVVLEVPNNDLKAVVHPIVCLSEVSSTGKSAGSVLSLSKSTVYDVNPMVTPTVSYQWQSTADGDTWHDISGETGDKYTLKAQDSDKILRLKLTATSENSAGEKKSCVSYTNSFSMSDKPSILKVSISGRPFVGSMLSASANIFNNDYVKSVDYLWQESIDGTSFFDTENSTDTISLTQNQKGKILRCKVKITDLENDEIIKYSNPVKIYSDEDEFPLYVDGKTTGDGTIDNPFKSVNLAIKEIRNLRKKGINNSFAIYIRGGEYFLDSPISITDEDEKITIRNYPGEEVTLTGGKHVEKKYIEKVTDEKILSRLVEKDAREHLYSADLSDYYDEIPEFANYKFSQDKYTFDKIKNQVQVVLNGASLTPAKWPNTIKQELGVTNRHNLQSFSYDDASNRALKWSEDGKKNLAVEGHFANHYSVDTYLVESIDCINKRVNTKESALDLSFNEGSFYFTNILDEIDLPGECFLDAENKKVYFYGYGDMENPDILVPIVKYPLISFNRGSDITIKNLTLQSARTAVLTGSNAKRCTIDGCNLKFFADENTFGGDKLEVKNCYFYDGSVAGLLMPGGNPDTMTGGENIVTNNKFNNTSKRLLSYGYGFQPYIANKPLISNNEFYNYPHCAIGLGGCNNPIFEYNYVHDCVKWTGDMGAIYWNARPNAMGFELRYNYFENNQSDYYTGWTQSVFADTAAPGYYAHHNIIYKGTRATSEGGTMYAFKTLGGQYSKITNNIFVDVPYGMQAQTFYPYGPNGEQTGWFLTQYGKETDGNMGGSFTEWDWSLFKNVIDSKLYEEYYKGTQWESYLKFFSMDFYNTNLIDLDRNKDKKALEQIALLYAPINTNEISGNVMIKSLEGKVQPKSNSFASESNTYSRNSDILNSGSSMFKEYGRDFTLTDEGLAEVRKTIPGFENIDMSKIGVKPYEVDGQTAFVGGNAPTLQNVTPMVEDNIYASYDFEDADGDKEGLSTFEWFESGDGVNYEKIDVGSIDHIDMTSHLGKYVKFAVIPYDDSGLNGAKYESAPKLIENIIIKTEAPILGSKTIGGRAFKTYKVRAEFSNASPNWVGFILKDSSSNKLEIESKSIENGKFGVTVFGEKLNGAYTLTPKIKVGDTEIFGEESKTFVFGNE